MKMTPYVILLTDEMAECLAGQVAVMSGVLRQSITEVALANGWPEDGLAWGLAIRSTYRATGL